MRGRGVRPGGEGRLWKECVRQLVTSVGDRGRLILPGHPSKGCVEGATKRSPRGAKKLNPKLHASLAGGSLEALTVRTVPSQSMRTLRQGHEANGEHGNSLQATSQVPVTLQPASWGRYY